MTITSQTIPRDGLSTLTYDATSNHITTSGYAYDAAGNQTRVVHADSSVQKYQYDAANRMVKVRNANGVVLATYTYGASNQRLVSQAGDENSNYRTYYAWGGDAVLAEYSENPSQPTSPQWTKSYIYLGARLLATLTPSGTSSELIQYHHPDRLGTRLVTNAQDTNSFEQVTLPFGTALDAESSGATNRRFTSYDRSTVTGLDYAVNRHYDAQQGRFTSVDPIGMSAASLSNPQSLNMYAYCGNDPVNRTDSQGLFWNSLAHALEAAFSAVGDFFSGIGQGIRDFFGGVGSFFGAVGRGIGGVVGAIGDALGGVVSGVIGAVGRVIGAVVGAITQVIGVVTGRGNSFANHEKGHTSQNTSPDKYISDKYKKQFNAALTEAEKLLKKDKCAELFGKTAEDLIAMLRNTEYRVLPLNQGGPKYDPNTGTTKVTGAQTNSPTSVFINSKGPFLNNVMFVPGAPRNPVTLDFGTGLRGKEFGALLLLHELGHQVKLFGADADNYDVNLSHTKQVLKACFGR